MLKPTFSDLFKKQYQKLPAQLRKKFDKQLKFLITDFRHPSLRTRKMGGEDKFEARLDHHNRFTYKIVDEEVFLLTIGPHDMGLGKK
ncbi:cytotoxin [Candidatus Gottesmanbacteria bacterium]|nr:cytotoxin [Candidatus Gottesmanbacteria bacterium]